MNKAIYFSGFGIAHGQFAVSNKEIEEAIDRQFIGDFDAGRIKKSDDYQGYIAQGGEKSPFEYFTENKMGFISRYHVVPFPPTKLKYKSAENVLDLAIKAMDMAINDSGIDPEKISLWLAGCATPHEQAPGIGATIKCHFVDFNNQAPATTINSACVGFNLNMERALDYFYRHPEIEHIAIIHTEVMSQLLTNEPSFVPYATFADAAAAVILSRSEVEKGEGVNCITNNEDMQMIDFLGADSNGNLYMNPQKVRERATTNIINTVNTLYQKTKWNNDIVDWIVPHQTGHAIVLSAAQKLQVPMEKLYQDVQLNYGNLSGSSVPFGLALLKKEGKLQAGSKIVTAVCGLGGEYGGFTYEVPFLKNNPKEPIKPLLGKKALVTGATGSLGTFLCKYLAKQGCGIYLHYNSNENQANNLIEELKSFNINIHPIQANFSDIHAADKIVGAITTDLDYIIHTSAITGNLLRASEVEIDEMKMVNNINYIIPSTITQRLHERVKECVLFVGSVAEDAMFSGSSSYVSSKRKIHAFATHYAGAARKRNVRTIYYMIGLLDKGMVEKLNHKQRAIAMSGIGQKQILDTSLVAERIVKSLYLPKVIGVKHSREGELVVRRDGFNIEI